MIKFPTRDTLNKTKSWVSIPFALTLSKLLTAHIFSPPKNLVAY